MSGPRRMPRRASLAVACMAAGSSLVGAGTASAAPPVNIMAFRVMEPGGKKPATQPLKRGVAYGYRLDYRIGGRSVVRVRRAGAFMSPYGDKLVSIRPRPQMADPGRYFAAGPIRVARSDSPGEYRLTYSITATDKSGSTTRTAELRMRFR
ncbi:MAG: hypothetical protein FJW99_05690 [Actinobacteria bacterium]|nr:hypothetical protein [Actinomycetota bacterium]MBM3698070.1 hypothetical protein [Actinomycetota bacterium]